MWPDFSAGYNFSYGSTQFQLNCSFMDVIEVHTLPYNMSDGQNPISEDGHLHYEFQEYKPQKYCIHNITEDDIEFQICQNKRWEKACGAEPCIRKCCPPNAVFTLEDDGGFKCINSTSIWEPTIYENEDEDTIISEDMNTTFNPIRFISSHPKEGWCKEFGPYILDSMEFEGSKYLIRILSNGNVIVKNHQLQPWRVLSHGSFCIDGIKRDASNIVDSKNDAIVVDCSPPDVEDMVEEPVYFVFQAIACCFLILTVSVYLILSERQNIHSWTLLSYAISMLCLHLSVFAIYAHNEKVALSDSSDWVCTSLAIVSHFLYLSTFCWLTLINFDVYWTFNNLTLTTARSKRKQRFIFYLLFAFLVPSAVLLFGFALKKLFTGKLDATAIYLEYSVLHCYINDSSALFFKFVPVAILLGCNVALFVITVITLYKIGESTKFATNKSSQNDTEKSKFLLFVKLFFVMGLIWILELVSYFAFGRASSNPVAYVLDVINILQPVAIFVIFVCKADIFRGLQVKLPCLRCLFQLLGLQFLRSRIGSGLSSTSVTTQISTSSTRSTAGENPGNNVSFEMK
ncbi:G-protein coupled receptor Mth2 [Folsomia candida]|uniref:G-protein coupled receptor Mth2 n=2 Tax=Folsomia candida TaxID=158441 RepID=A0A226EFV2_FOLCA|nr:G-protein coupled receptor Mth2 [Folsomia candida]